MVKKCAFGEVNRQMIIDMKETVNAGFKDLKGDVNVIKTENKEMFNHMSSRLPNWATVLITVLSSVVVGSLVKLLS